MTRRNKRLAGIKISVSKPKRIADDEGWFDFEKYKPNLFDLIFLMDKKGRRLICWWDGSMFDGFNLPKEIEPIKWKFKRVLSPVNESGSGNY